MDADPDTEGNQTALTVREGGSASYTVKLNIAPTANVTVAIAEGTGSNDDTSIRVTSPSNKTLTFTPQNWNNAQTVRIRANSDSDAVNGTRTINHTASGAAEFAGKTESLTATGQDSQAAVVIDADSTRSGNQTSVSVNEGGGATYSVSLAAKPAANVTVTPSVSGDGSFSVAPAFLTFTPDNYGTAQTLTVTAATDDTELANGSATVAHTAGSAGDAHSGYDGVPARNLTATEIDKTGKVEIRNAADTADITTLGVPEGGSATYKVKLNVKPTGSVTVRLALQSTSGNDPGDRDITASPTTLYFNTGNWSQAQTVTVRAAQDDDYTIGSRAISHTASGGGFNVTTPVVLTASEVDDEASFLFTNAGGDAIAGLTVPEGGSADYYVALSTPPASAVQVNLAATGDISVSPSLVIFTTTNWDTAQKVTASAAEEAPAQPSATNKDNTVNEEETITHTAASGDAVYHGKTIALAATGQDNDPGIVIRNAADDAYVTELDVREGSSAAYTVKLNSPPLAGDVTVTITGKTTVPGNDTDITVDTDASTGGNQNTLTFNATNWNTARTVTVRAANDNSVRKCVPSRVFTHTADGGDFSLAPEALLTATELDNDSRHIVLCSVSGNSAVSSLIVPEGVGAPYSVRLNRRPSGNVTVSLSAASSGDADITVSPASLTFTADNWSVPQAASLWAAEDDDLVSGNRNINHTASGHSSTTLLAVEQDNDTQNDRGNSLLAYDTTATTVLLQATVTSSGGGHHSTETYYYTSYPDTSSLECSEASLFQVFGQLAPGTEYGFSIYDDARCRFGDLKASSNRVTTKQVTLASSNVTGSGATLSVSGWTHTKGGLTRDGDWHYRADTGPDAASCSAAQTGDSVTLTGLVGGTTYNYAMYRDADCATSIGAFPAFTTPGRAMTADTTATTAALALPGYASNWYHKHDGAGAACLGPVSGSATGYVSGLTKNTEYTFTAYSNSGCTTKIASRRQSTPTPALTTDNLLPTSATLTLSGWVAGTGDGKDGPWYYQANQAPHNNCSTTPQTTNSVDLSGLTPGVTYTYTAYSDGSCTAVIAVTSTFATQAGTRASDTEDIAMQSVTDDVAGIWSDGTTLWATQYNGHDKIYAYKMSDGSRDSPMDITLPSGNLWTRDITSDGTYIWFSHWNNTSLRAYKLSDRSRQSTKDIALHTANGNADALWTDGTTMWVMDTDDTFVYAYAVSDGTRQDGTNNTTNKEFDLHSDHGFPAGMWGDDHTIWVSDYTVGKVFAYRLSDGTRLPGKDYVTLKAAGNDEPTAMWSNGNKMWIGDYNDAKLYAYYAFPPELALTVTGIGETTATLRLLNYSGDWWYKSTTTGQTTCTSVSSGTSTVSFTTLTSGLSYTFTAYSDSTCSTVIAAAPAFITSSKALTVTGITTTTATLKLLNYSGDWWYKSTTTGQTTCTSVSGTYTKSLTTLTPGLSYTFTAYSDSTCSTVIAAAPAFTLLGPGDRYSSNDIAIDLTEGSPNTNARAGNIWSDGTTIWASEASGGHELQAYTLATGARDGNKEITIFGHHSIFTSDGTTVWILRDIGATTIAYAYSLSGKSRDETKDINLAAVNRGGIAMGTDGETLWVADEDDARVYAYTLSTGARDIGKEFNLHADNVQPTAMWTDDALIWVTDRFRSKVYAYNLVDGSRVPGKDYASLDNEGSNPVGIWSNGTTTWMSSYENVNKLFAYVAHPLSKRLLVTATATTAQLELTQHTGSWYYKADTGPHSTTCSAEQTGTTANLTGLTPGATYSYKAYSDNGCADVIASARAFTTNTPVLTASYGNTVATLALSGWVAGTGDGKDGNWHYKADSSPHAACSSTAQTSAFAHLSGLTANTAYTYTAYSDGNCANAIDAAPAFITHTGPLGFTVGDATATTMPLTLSNYGGDWWFQHTGNSAPCVAASGATALATGLTKTTSYTFKAYSAEGCDSADVIATAAAKSTATPTLTVSKIKSRTATLTLDGWDPAHEGPWRFKGTASPFNSCYYGGATKDAESRISARAYKALTPGNNYTFRAYAGTSCSGTAIDSVTFSALADPLRPGEFDDGKSYATGDLKTGETDDHGHQLLITDADDIWSNGTTLWLHSRDLGELAAFNLSTKARDLTRDISVGSVWRPVSVAGDGTTVWMGQRHLNRLWAYSLARKVRTPGKDITLHPDNGDRSALWTDGTTMWVADNEDDKLYAYAVSGGARQPDKEINIAGLDARAMWSDGTTLWIPAVKWNGQNRSRNSEPGVLAYKLSDGTRQSGKDYDYYWGESAGNRIRLSAERHPVGLWSNGATTWVMLRLPNGRNIAAYVAIPRLEASNVTATAATLKLHGHTRAWWYKRTAGTPADATCHSVAAGTTTASLSSLTTGQSYTYTAYDKTNCNSADEIASVTFTAQAASGSGASAQAQGGGASSGLPVLRIDGAGAAAWEYTLPTGATFVSAELRWVATAGLSADGWTGAQSRSFTGASVAGHSIAGLQSGVEYKAQVTVSVTVGGAARSAASATLVFTLPAATAALPGNVATVLAVHNGGNVSALWTGASDATGYEARYSADNGATWTSATAPSVGTAMTITNLSSGKSYVVGIRATNAAGKGSWTNSAQVSVGASLSGAALVATGSATAQTGPPPGGATAQTGGATGLAAVLAAINRYFSGEGTLADVHAAMQTYFN